MREAGTSGEATELAAPPVAPLPLNNFGAPAPEWG